MNTFKDLDAWIKAHQLVVSTYQISKHFPVSERYGLTQQIRRSAVSVTSNIAEGFGRFSQKDKLHFYIMARGSLFELHSQLLVSASLKYVSAGSQNNLEDQITSSTRLLQGLIRSTRSRKY